MSEVDQEDGRGNTKNRPGNMSEFAKFIAFDYKKCADEANLKISSMGGLTSNVDTFLEEDEDDSFLRSFKARDTTPKPSANNSIQDNENPALTMMSKVGTSRRRTLRQPDNDTDGYTEEEYSTVQGQSKAKMTSGTNNLQRMSTINDRTVEQSKRVYRLIPDDFEEKVEKM